MKKIIFLIIPFFLFAQAYIGDSLSSLTPVLSSGGSCVYGHSIPSGTICLLFQDGNNNGVLATLGARVDLSKKYNSSCVNKNSVKVIGTWNGELGVDVKYYTNLSFCAFKDGYIYNQSDNAWFPTSSDTNASPICPNDEQWSSSQEKCVKKPDLSKLQQQCDTYCGGSQFVKFFQASSDGSNVVCKCYTCSDLSTIVLNYCKSNGYKVKNFQCSGDGSHILKTNYSGSPSLSDCYVPQCSSNQHLQVNQDGYKVCVNDANSSKSSSGSGSDNNSSGISNQQQCLNSGGNWLCQGGQCQCVFSNGSSSNSSGSIASGSNSSSSNSSGSIASGSNSSSSNSSGSIASGSNSSNSNSNSKEDCCYYYKNKQLGDIWTLISSQNGVSVWKKKGSDCQVSIRNGVCSDLSSGSNDSNSSGSLNSSLLSSISSKISDTNTKLNNINNNLKDIINLKPDKQPNGQLDSKTKSFISGFSNTINNIKNSIDSLKNSASKVLALLKSPSKVSLFHSSDIQTCPVNFTIYNQTKTFDVCRVVSPYRPFIQLIFTLFFSISVLLYFFDVFIRSK